MYRFAAALPFTRRLGFVTLRRFDFTGLRRELVAFFFRRLVAVPRVARRG